LKSSPDENIRAQAVYELGGMGDLAKSSVSLIVPLLREENGVILEGFAKMGAHAVPALIQVIRDNKYSDSFRGMAAANLGEIGKLAEPAIPSLIELLTHQDEMVRGRSAYALGKIGGAAKSAIPSLIPLLKDQDPNVRAWTQDALSGLGYNQ
jgi:HEAT repeat protein